MAKRFKGASKIRGRKPHAKDVGLTRPRRPSREGRPVGFRTGLDQLAALTVGSMSEKNLQEAVRKIVISVRGNAGNPDLLYYHTHDSRRSPAGFPDCVFAWRSGRVVYAELKSEKGRLTPDQRRWLDYLALSGAPVYVWRPEHLLDGTIHRVLVAEENLSGPESGRWNAPVMLNKERG